MKLGSWAYDFSLKTVRVDPVPKKYSEALGEKELVIYFTKETLIPIKSEANTIYYDFIVFLSNIIHKTFSILTLDKFLIMPDFKQTIGDMLLFLVCEKRFALQTWCDQFTEVLFMESILFSLMRIIKYFLYFHEKIVSYAEVNRNPESDTLLREVASKLPVSFEILEKLMAYISDETKQIIKKTKSKFKKGFPFMALLKLNSLASLYIEMAAGYLKGYICGDNNWNRMIEVLDNVDVFLNTGDIMMCLVATGELKMISRSNSEVSDNENHTVLVI